MNIIIPMAGKGSRFPRDRYPPKPLINVLGKPMVVRAVQSLGFKGTHHFIIRRDENTNYLKELLTNAVAQANFIEINYTTEGPACSALLCEEFINNREELIIANCDQIMEWDYRMFPIYAQYYDGCVVTYTSDTPKNSYVKINNHGIAVELKEKQVISNISLNGIHYWRIGKDFVTSARKMIEANDRAPNGEFYIAPTYNYMIKYGQRVGIFHIPNEQHHAVGDPDDLEKYLKRYENT